MAYVLNALIADLDLLRRATLPVVPLSQGKGLVPLDATFWRELGGMSRPLLSEWDARHPSAEDFDDPSERATHIAKAATSFTQLAALVEQLSTAGPVAYVESNYWAGSGSEAAAVWNDGVLALHPLVAADAVNQALRRIGVSGGALDGEFTVLGLGRFRMTDDWRKAANQPLAPHDP
jgi:hypothetical protein